MLVQVQTERNGFVINRSAVKGCVDIFLQLRESPDTPDMYKRILEPPILRESESFYKAEGEHLLETCDAPEYLRRVRMTHNLCSHIAHFVQVEERFYAEESRTHHYLSSQTYGILRKILEDHLLTAHLTTILSMPNSGLDVMIDTDKKEDLSRLYRLFVMVPNGLATIRRALRDSIVRRGKELAVVNTTTGDDGAGDDDSEDVKGKGKVKATNAGAQTLQLALKWVQDVLDLKDKFDTLWTQAFRSDRDIETGINEVRSAVQNYWHDSQSLQGV